jgi:hypothetical protein
MALIHYGVKLYKQKKYYELEELSDQLLPPLHRIFPVKLITSKLVKNFTIVFEQVETEFHHFFVAFEVLGAVIVKRSLFHDITLCSRLKGNQRFNFSAKD